MAHNEQRVRRRCFIHRLPLTELVHARALFEEKVHVRGLEISLALAFSLLFRLLTHLLQPAANLLQRAGALEIDFIMPNVGDELEPREALAIHLEDKTIRLRQALAVDCMQLLGANDLSVAADVRPEYLGV